MKGKLIRVSRLNISGESKKTGKAYAIDRCNVALMVECTNEDAIGYKEVEYEYSGGSVMYGSLMKFAGHLPLECDVDLDVDLDNYGNPITVVTNIKPLVPIVSK